MFKIVLSVEVPGDLSDHGVGVAHKAAAVLQKKGKNTKEFQMDEGKDAWLIIPNSDYIRSLAADADELWQPGAGHNLQAWARKAHTQMADRIYDLPSGLNRAIREGDYKVPWSLQQRRDRHAMETGAERGHTGEEARTIMTMDGEDVMRNVVHILGFFVGYMCCPLHKHTTNDKRNNYADLDLDIKNLLTCGMPSKCV